MSTPDNTLADLTYALCLLQDAAEAAIMVPLADDAQSALRDALARSTAIQKTIDADECLPKAANILDALEVLHAAAEITLTTNTASTRARVSEGIMLAERSLLAL
ncbi:MAG: hypothetical protein PF961_14080 [Planctomycetota bacterium]|jgi:hypothetical protein|nr:hypothetical protein [Planctomycetota bacterium]